MSYALAKSQEIGMDAFLKQGNTALAAQGLTLSRSDALSILRERKDALRESGRVEIGAPAAALLIEVFAGSAYLMQENLAQDIAEIQRVFYAKKSESEQDEGQAIPDDALAQALRHFFDHETHGCAQDLADVPVAALRRFTEAENAGEYDAETQLSYHEKESAKDAQPERVRDELSRVFEEDAFERPGETYALLFFEEFYDPLNSCLSFDRRIGGSAIG